MRNNVSRNTTASALHDINIGREMKKANFKVFRPSSMKEGRVRMYTRSNIYSGSKNCPYGKGISFQFMQYVRMKDIEPFLFWKRCSVSGLVCIDRFDGLSCLVLSFGEWRETTLNCSDEQKLFIQLYFLLELFSLGHHMSFIVHHLTEKIVTNMPV